MFLCLYILALAPLCYDFFVCLRNFFNEKLLVNCVNLQLGKHLYACSRNTVSVCTEFKVSCFFLRSGNLHYFVAAKRNQLGVYSTQTTVFYLIFFIQGLFIICLSGDLEIAALYNISDHSFS